MIHYVGKHRGSTSTYDVTFLTYVGKHRHTFSKSVPRLCLICFEWAVE